LIPYCGTEFRLKLGAKKATKEGGAKALRAGKEAMVMIPPGLAFVICSAGRDVLEALGK
jgi:hypothetical protein